MTYSRVDVPAGGKNHTPAYRDIYQRVRTEILSGRLSARARLPSSRTLASQLGVARGTVELAYQILAGEGYTVSDGARGTIVNPSLPSERRPITFASSARKPPHRLRLPPKPLLFPDWDCRRSMRSRASRGRRSRAAWPGASMSISSPIRMT